MGGNTGKRWGVGYVFAGTQKGKPLVTLHRGDDLHLRLLLWPSAASQGNVLVATFKVTMRRPGPSCRPPPPFPGVRCRRVGHQPTRPTQATVPRPRPLAHLGPTALETIRCVKYEWCRVHLSWRSERYKDYATLFVMNPPNLCFQALCVGCFKSRRGAEDPRMLPLQASHTFLRFGPRCSFRDDILSESRRF